MNTKLLTVLVGLVVLVGGLSAVGAATPADASNSDAEPTVGPADGLAEPVPDFVGEILGAISNALSSVMGGVAELAGQGVDSFTNNAVYNN